jgi:hypothetical protein
MSFKNMNLARVIMLVALLGSLVLGWLGWMQRQTLVEMRKQLSTDMPELVKKVEAAGRRHTQLAKNLDKEGLKGQENLLTYAVKCATADRVEIGDIDPTQQTDKNINIEGVEDKRLRAKPKDPKRPFTRTRIANYLFKLEEASKRVKVTDIEIGLIDTKVKKHEVPEDNWTFDVEITSRQRVQ